MIFGERLRPETSPHRVYALCKLVNHKKLTKDEIRDLLQPKAINNRQNDVNRVYNFALNGNLIKEDSNGFVYTSLSEKDLESHDKFRKKMAKIILSDSESMFFKFNSWFLDQGENMFQYTSSKDMQRDLRGEFIKIKEEDLLGWRFWTTYLGLGFLHGPVVIPNAFIRIKDSIEDDLDIEREKSISFGKFMDWLMGKCPELKQGIKGNDLSLGVSLGLRTLHDQGYITLGYTRDAGDIWHLVRIDTHDIPEDVTEIVIGRW